MRASKRSLISQLTRTYVVALATVAALTMAGQALVQRGLEQQAGDAETINLAGRQRMLSQRIVKEGLAATRSGLSDDHRRVHRQALVRALDEWEDAHAILVGNDLRSDALVARYHELEPIRLRMATAGEQIASAAGPPPETALRSLLAEEAGFLEGMETIVALHDREATARVSRTRWLELMLAILTLVVLALEARFVFRPAVSAAAQAFDDRDRAAEAVLTAADRERQRLGRELHDGLCQQLSGMKMLMEASARRGEVDAAHASRFVAHTEDAREEAYRMSRALTPAPGLARGLGPALQELLAAQVAPLNVQVELEVDDRAEPPGEETRSHLMRIAQEAVSNALRHGDPSRVRVSVRRKGEGLILEIEDDGVGLPVAEDRIAGVGLASMQWRAAALGGRLTLERLSPRGTRVRCWLDANIFEDGSAWGETA